MKIKADQVFTIFNDPNILETLNKLNSKQLPIKIRYNMTKIFKKLQSEFNLLQEQRQKIVNNHAVKENNNIKTDKQGRIKWKSDEESKKALEELKELADIDIEVGNIELIDIEDPKLENITLDGAEMEFLYPFIKKD